MDSSLSLNLSDNTNETEVSQLTACPVGIRPSDSLMRHRYYTINITE